MSRSKDTVPGKRGIDPLRSVHRILVVDDEPAVAQSVARVLRADDRLIDVVSDGVAAREHLERAAYDLVISDVRMPNMTGDELLRAIRERDLDLPVILLTGGPTLESAIAAVELGAFRYLLKPYDIAELRRVADEAIRMRGLSRTKDAVAHEARAELERSFRGAMVSLRMAYQPIVDARTRAVVGYEALMRSSQASLPHPGAVLDAAEKLGMLHVLGRRIRNLVANEADQTTGKHLFYVNIHPADLADADLYDPVAPLSRHAQRTILELTERASLEATPDLDTRFAQLRALGYRLAVDDLGAGYAGLSYFARVQPEIVKIDMSLVRGIATDPVRQRVVLSIIGLATPLGMEVVAEGVETVEERDTVVRLGCTYVQGYALAKPGPPYPEVTWA